MKTGVIYCFTVEKGFEVFAAYYFLIGMLFALLLSLSKKKITEISTSI